MPNYFNVCFFLGGGVGFMLMFLKNKINSVETRERKQKVRESTNTTKELRLVSKRDSILP